MNNLGGGSNDKSKYKKLEMPIFIGVNWESWVWKFVAFMVGNKMIILERDPLLTTTECSLKMITKTWDEKDQGF